MDHPGRRALEEAEWAGLRAHKAMRKAMAAIDRAEEAAWRIVISHAQLAVSREQLRRVRELLNPGHDDE